MELDFSSEQNTILVIEDNPGDFFLLESILEDLYPEAKIDNATSQKEAIDYIKEKSEMIGLIFLDYTLPDERHLALVENILKVTADIPVIVNSGYEDPNTPEACERLGTKAFINKNDLSETAIAEAVSIAFS